MGAPRLSDRVAFVTGGGAGIGRAIALDLAREGARLAVLDIDHAAADETVQSLVEAGAHAVAFGADVADSDALRQAIDETVDGYGRLDILVNNAATFAPDIMATDVDVETTPVETWDRVMAVDLRAAMLACKYAIPHMRRTAGQGVIINVSSTAAYNGDVVHVSYSAAKAALQALTRSIATTHGRKGIRCNTVATGLVLTATAERNLDPKKLDAYRRNRLVDEVGRPEEIASLVTYLASDDARYIQGQAIIVDGGATAHQPWHVLSDILHPEVFRA